MDIISNSIYYFYYSILSPRYLMTSVTRAYGQDFNIAVEMQTYTAA